MTDAETQTPRDIALRIAEAVARTGEPNPSANGDFDPKEDTLLGEVPAHLRHLHNLLHELGEEVAEAGYRYRQAKKRHGAVHAIFFDALETHVPSDQDNYDGVKLCVDWQVVGFKHDKRRGADDAIGAVFAKMMAEAMDD